MHQAIFYCIEQARQLNHGNMEAHISGHFYKIGEWGLALQWLDKAFKKGSLRDVESCNRLKQEIFSKIY